MGNKSEAGNGLIRSCQKAIQIPSEAGEEKEIAKYIKGLMEELGYDEAWLDGCGNAIGRINCSTGSNDNEAKTVLLDGHMDTVGVKPGSWNYDPYGGIIKNGRMYGRGASDMKSALIAMIYAAIDIAASEELQGNIVVAGIVQEEVLEGIAQSEVLDHIKPDIVIIGEASELKLCTGQRGRAEIKVTTYGQSAHSSNPEVGVNAVSKMMKLLRRLEEEIKLPFMEPFGRVVMELTDIHSLPYPGRSVIPEECMVTFDRRLLPGETEESVLQPVKDVIESLGHSDDDFRASATITSAEEECYTGTSIRAEKFFPGWKFSPEEGFIRRARQGLKEVGLEGELSYYSFCTNGSQSAGERGIPTIGFGPSREDLAHIADEYIEIEEIKKAYQGYRGLLKGLLS